MPIPQKYLADFEEYGIYHVYNRTNNRERLFLSDENRYFFLQKYFSYLSHVLDTYCWCLLPNHFHFLNKIKSIAEIQKNLLTWDFMDLPLTEQRFLEKKATLSELIEHSFKRFFQCYAVSFNNVHERNGNLFYKPLKRVSIDTSSYFTQAVVYIHTNPVKHNLANDFTQYKWSSWKTILSDKPTKLLRSELLELFGGRTNFVDAHMKMTEDKTIYIEED